MAKPERNQNNSDREPESVGFSKKDLLQAVVWLFAMLTAVFAAFALYQRMQGSAWIIIVVFAAITGAGTLYAMRLMRRASAGEPLLNKRGQMPQSPTPGQSESQEAKSEAALALEEKIVYLRFLDEFQQALADLDQTGECVLPQSLLRREKVREEQAAAILTIWIMQDFDEMVDIKTRDAGRGKVRFFDPEWEKNGPYSAPSDSDSGDSAEDE